MSDPQIELIPARGAVCSDLSMILDVLIRISPPKPEIHFPRPALNLALVIDRSGSMAAGKKMAYAIEASAFVVQQLLPTDRISVVIFDQVVEVLVPGGPATDKLGLVRRIQQVQPRGSTDLHAGWAEGGRQAAAGLVPGGINRVLLLSDGIANSGVVDPNVIAAEASGLVANGVSTTTLGVGDDYNEDLLESMAMAGDGNYYYIESPVQLADLFQTELQGLMATLGQKVSLGLEPAEGVQVQEVLNDLERGPNGRLMLPNMVVGMPIPVVVRLKLPPMPTGSPVLTVRLAWDDSHSTSRRVARASLGGLPAIPMTEWSALPELPEVAEQVALLMVARAQKEAARSAEIGDVSGSLQWLHTAREAASSIPGSPVLTDELAVLDQMVGSLGTLPKEAFVKQAKYRSYQHRQARPNRSPKSPDSPDDAKS